MRAMESTK